MNINKVLSTLIYTAALGYGIYHFNSPWILLGLLGIIWLGYTRTDSKDKEG